MNDERGDPVLPIECGFQWGQLKVQRTAEINGRKLVRLQAKNKTIDIYVSRTGSAIRVYNGYGDELIPTPKVERVNKARR